MKKKICIIFSILIFVLLFSACKKEENNEDNKNNDPEVVEEGEHIYFTVTDAIMVAENAGKQCHRTGHIDRDIQQAFHRTVEPVDHIDGRGDRTDGQRGIVHPDDEIAAGQIDQQRSEVREDAHDDPEPASGP